MRTHKLVDHRIAQEREANIAQRQKRVAAAQSDYFKEWYPDWIGTITFDGAFAPSAATALKRLRRYFGDVEVAAQNGIAWFLSIDRGKFGNRVHAHFLVAGVDHLSRHVWWKVACEQFGRTRIEPFDYERGGAYYVAMNGLSEHGELHFGGKLLERNKNEQR